MNETTSSRRKVIERQRSRGSRHQAEQPAIRRSGSSASAGQRVDLGRPPGELVVLVVGGDGRAVGEPRLPDQQHDARSAAARSASIRSRSGSTDHSSRSSRADRVGRVLVDLDRAAGAERPAPRPRREPGGAPAGQPAAVGGAHDAQHRRGSARRPSGISRSAQRAGWSSSGSRPSAASKSTSRAASPSWLGEPRSRSASSATSAASIALGSRLERLRRQATSTCAGIPGTTGEDDRVPIAT